MAATSAALAGSAAAAAAASTAAVAAAGFPEEAPATAVASEAEAEALPQSRDARHDRDPGFQRRDLDLSSSNGYVIVGLTVFNYTGTVVEYTIPTTGFYFVAAVGAQGDRGLHRRLRGRRRGQRFSGHWDRTGHCGWRSGTITLARSCSAAAAAEALFGTRWPFPYRGRPRTLDLGHDGARLRRARFRGLAGAAADRSRFEIKKPRVSGRSARGEALAP